MGRWAPAMIPVGNAIAKKIFFNLMNGLIVYVPVFLLLPSLQVHCVFSNWRDKNTWLELQIMSRQVKILYHRRLQFLTEYGSLQRRPKIKQWAGHQETSRGSSSGL